MIFEKRESARFGCEYMVWSFGTGGENSLNSALSGWGKIIPRLVQAILKKIQNSKKKKKKRHLPRLD